MAAQETPFPTLGEIDDKVFKEYIEKGKNQSGSQDVHDHWRDGAELFRNAIVREGAVPYQGPPPERVNNAKNCPAVVELDVLSEYMRRLQRICGDMSMEEELSLFAALSVQRRRVAQTVAGQPLTPTSQRSAINNYSQTKQWEVEFQIDMDELAGRGEEKTVVEIAVEGGGRPYQVKLNESMLATPVGNHNEDASPPVSRGIICYTAWDSKLVIFEQGLGGLESGSVKEGGKVVFKDNAGQTFTYTPV